MARGIRQKRTHRDETHTNVAPDLPLLYDGPPGADSGGLNGWRRIRAAIMQVPDIKYHLVWIRKYRYKVLKGEGPELPAI
jgi:hypothetical protein